MPIEFPAARTERQKEREREREREMAADPPNYFVPLNRNRRCRLNWSRLDYAIERGGSLPLSVLISIAITPTIVRLQCRNKDSPRSKFSFDVLLVPTCAIAMPLGGGGLYRAGRPIIRKVSKIRI